MFSYKLGKKLGRVVDPRTLKLKSLLTLDTPVPPLRHTVALHATFPMYANDVCGCCTCTAHGHRIVAQERSAAQSAVPTVTDRDVVKAYSAITGYDPRDPNTDQGAYPLDVLKYMRNVGIGKEADGTPHTIYAFAEVDVHDHDQVKLAHYLFGGLYIGASLPVAAQDQVGGLWDLTGTRADKWGSWGGHCMYTQSYGPNELVNITWAARQRLTWRWWDKYVDEAYVVISEDFLKTRTQLTPQGFDVAKLNAYLANL